MNRQRWLQAIAILAVGGFVWSTVSVRMWHANKSATAADAGGPGRGSPTRVQAVHPRRDDLIRVVRMQADVMPYDDTPVLSEVAGRVSSEPVNVGTRLKAGDTLLELSVPELDAALLTADQAIAMAAATVAQAAAVVREAGEGVNQAQAAVKQAEVRARKAKGMIRAAEAEASKARADLASRESIFKRLEAAREKSPNLVSPEKVDEARGAYEVARAQFEIAQVGVEGAKDNLAVAEAAVEGARAAVGVAEGHVASARAKHAAAEAAGKSATTRKGELEARKGLATLTAPYDCVVAARMVDQGQVVRNGATNSGAKPLYRVLNDNRLRIRFFLSLPDAPHVRIGNTVRIKFDEFPDWPQIEAPVSRVAEAFDGKTLQMKAEVDLWNVFDVDGKFANFDPSASALPSEPTPDMKARGRRLLRADTLARISVDLETRANVLVVPVACVKTKKQKSWVMVVNSEGIVRKKTVIIGATDGHRIEIKPPPAEDKDAYRMATSDKVISKGSAMVSDGEAAEAVVKEW